MTGALRIAAAVATLLAATPGQQGETRPSRSAPPFAGVASRENRPATPVEAFADAVHAGDASTAAAALDGALRARAGRGDALRATLDVARAVGRTDLWLAGAAAAADADPSDAFASYVVGWAFQRAKLLRRAEPYLARAATAAPSVWDYARDYATNAFLRFDRAESRRRAAAAPASPERDRYLADLDAPPPESGAGRAIAALVLSLASAAAVGAFLRRRL
jgi:hypothetical protein